MLATFLPLFTFLGIGLFIVLLGRVLLGIGQGRRVADLDKRSHGPVFGFLTPAIAGLIPSTKNQLTSLDKELKRAGFYRKHARIDFLAIRNSLVFGWLVLVGSSLVAAVEPGYDPTRQILIAGAIVLFVLYAAPRLWLQAQGTRRMHNIQHGLPDALDMLSMCLSGGLPLQHSLERVGQELRGTHADLAFELEIVRRQASAHTLDHALVQFADRIDAPEIRALTSLVSQTERLGTNVAPALRDYADGVRRSYRQRAEELGNKNSVKMLLPVTFCLAPPVYILLLAPAILELREFMVRENRLGGALAPADTTVQQRPSLPTAAGVARALETAADSGS